MLRLLTALYFATISLSNAGVYGTLEFGDTREEVTKKLQASEMVEHQLDSAFFGRTGLNGVFKCKAKLAGLTYHLYFDWTDSGGLREITLRSNEISLNEFNGSLKDAWTEANKLFTQVYNRPVQAATYPAKRDLEKHDILITHVWHQGARQSILIGPGAHKNKCFLAIRFVNEHIKPVRVP